VTDHLTGRSNGTFVKSYRSFEEMHCGDSLAATVCVSGTVCRAIIVQEQEHFFKFPPLFSVKMPFN
jgi:hypothetical protein